MARNSCGVINIPLDLIVEILEKLPTKSLARFRCVSYQWESIINNYIVIDSIVTRRSNQPPRDPHFFFEKRFNEPQRGLRWRSSPKPCSILSYTFFFFVTHLIVYLPLSSSHRRRAILPRGDHWKVRRPSDMLSTRTWLDRVLVFT